MTDAAAITLPDDLRPVDGRFGSGPSKVRPESVAALADTSRNYLGTSHRRAGVRDVVRRVRGGMAELFSLPDGYEVLLGNGGTTSFWDAASFGLIERRAQHASIGEFSAKFATVTRRAPHLDDPEVIESAPGTTPAPCRASETVDAYCFPHNETSTGVMMTVQRPDGIAADDLMLVDATSGAGGLRVDLRACDAYYFAPQKCFAGDGGLWLSLMSPAAIERIERIEASRRGVPASLDLAIALENSRLQQTYNTPALATIFLLAQQVEWMLGLGGLEACARRCDASAGVVYGWADRRDFATPFVADESARSHVTATIDFEGVQADQVAEALRANGIVDVEPYRKLGRNQLRIAMFPAIDTTDLEILTRAIDHIVGRL